MCRGSSLHVSLMHTPSTPTFQTCHPHIHITGGRQGHGFLSECTPGEQSRAHARATHSGKVPTHQTHQNRNHDGDRGWCECEQPESEAF